MIAALIIFSFICSCGLVTGKGDAEKVAESFLNERIENGGFGSDTYYSEIFWDNTDIEKWEGIQRLVENTMGDLKSYELRNWKVNTQAKTNNLSGTIVYLLYETVYEKGKGTEILTIYKPILGEKYAIVGHNFDSPEIQKLIDKGIDQALLQDAQ
jgi:hypothetical protein